MNTVVKYGIGGYDPELPNDNVIELIVDNGDGTGTRTTYIEDGDPVVENITGLPIVEYQPTVSVEAITLLASQLVLRASDLWDALVEIENENSARQAIEIVTDAALNAALFEEVLT